MTEAKEQERPDPEAGAPEEPPLQPEVPPDRFAALSPQERRLLNMVADGLTDNEIGDQLSMPERAVAKYIEDMLSKLGLQTRTQAILFAINRAFQSTDPSSAHHSDEPS